MSINRWMDKDIVYIYIQWNITQPKKECIWVSSSEVDEPTACYTDWSKSERKKQISYINANTWNLKNWFWWTYLQGRDWDADIKNRLCTQQWKARVRQIERLALKYLQYHMQNRHLMGSCCIKQGAQCCPRGQSRGVIGVGKKFESEGIYTYSWLMLYGRSQCSCVKQLFSN